MLRKTLFASTLVLGLGVSVVAEATHFRYGHLNWEPVAGQPNTINVQVQNVWRRDSESIYCVDGTIPTHPVIACKGPGGLPGIDPVSGEKDIIYEGQGATTLYWQGASGGVSTGVLYYQVSSFDEANNWFFGVAIDPGTSPMIADAASPNDVDTAVTHTYPQAGSYTVEVNSCCRLLTSSGHVNNGGLDYRMMTNVTVGTGLTNRSPVSVQLPIWPCAPDAECVIPIAVADPDNNPLTLRMATASEAAGFDPFVQPAGADVGFNSGSGLYEYTWNTTGAIVNSVGPTYYSTQIIISDGSTQVPVDFFIEITNDTDIIPPVIDDQNNPVCGTTQVFQIGETKTFSVTGSDVDAADEVTLNVVGLPGGATMTPSLPQTGAAGADVTSTFQWTPTVADVGTHVASFSVTSSSGGAGACAVVLEVTADPQPPVIVPGADQDSVCDTTQLVPYGQELTFDVVGTDADVADALTLDSQFLPTGAVMNPALPITGAAGESVLSTFSWTPTAAELGLITEARFTVASSAGGLATCNVGLEVVEPQPEPTVNKCDADGDLDIDGDDINLILGSMDPSRPVDPNDARDLNSDGIIWLDDYAGCVGLVGTL